MKRLVLVVPLFALFACGGGDQMTDGSTVPPDLTMPNIPPGDMAMSGGCGAENGMCQVGNQTGLCRSGSCVPCSDNVDDATCTSAYGAGSICANGSCVVGCHDSTTCSGKVCDSSTSQCRNCTQDAECTGTDVCNTATGTCGVAPTCTNDTKCGANGWCCGTTCYPNTGKNGCCAATAATDCTKSSQAGTCGADHICKPTLCTAAVSGSKFYVDPTATDTMSGVGTTQCPYQSLDAALSAAAAKNLPWTICTKGTFDASSDSIWPRFVPKNVELDGTYCSTTTSTHTIFKVPSGNDGVNFKESGPATIHGFDIIYQGTAKGHDGIYVTNSSSIDPVNIYDVTINGFQYGIHVGQATRSGVLDSPGNAYIHHDTLSNMNATGLYLGGKAKALVSVVTNTLRADFNNNDFYGIQVSDSGNLTVTGVAFATGTSRTVRADFNTLSGLYVPSADATVSLDWFSGTSNDRQGLSLVNTAKVKATNSIFDNNKIHGINVFNSGTSTTLTGVNFGTAATGVGAGSNIIAGNLQSGVCISFDDTANPLPLEGNSFGTNKDCGGTHTLPVTTGTDCTRALDIAGTKGGNVAGKIANYDACSAISCNGVTTGGCPQ